MDPESAEILIEHFFNGKTLLCISRLSHITERHVQRKLHNAITEFQSILNTIQP